MSQPQWISASDYDETTQIPVVTIGGNNTVYKWRDLTVKVKVNFFVVPRAGAPAHFKHLWWMTESESWEERPIQHWQERGRYAAAGVRWGEDTRAVNAGERAYYDLDKHIAHSVYLGKQNLRVPPTQEEAIAHRETHEHLVAVLNTEALRAADAVIENALLAEFDLLTAVAPLRLRVLEVEAQVDALNAENAAATATQGANKGANK